MQRSYRGRLPPPRISQRRDLLVLRVIAISFEALPSSESQLFAKEAPHPPNLIPYRARARSKLESRHPRWRRVGAVRRKRTAFRPIDYRIRRPANAAKWPALRASPKAWEVVEWWPTRIARLGDRRSSDWRSQQC